MNIAGLVVSLTALAISIYSLQHNRFLDRRNLSLKLHETLIAPEQQNGRRILFGLEGDVTELSDQDYTLANRALASLDIVGLYCDKKYVDVDEFLDLWAATFVKLKYAAAPFVAHRNETRPLGAPMWPYYTKLVDRAEAHLTARGIKIPRPSAPTA